MDLQTGLAQLFSSIASKEALESRIINKGEIPQTINIQEIDRPYETSFDHESHHNLVCHVTININIKE